MAIKRPAPKQLSEEARKAITEASQQQDGRAQKIKSYDPDYPVFDTPINQKVLVYIPNHVVQMPDGSITLRKDKFAAHQGIDGRAFVDIRCSQGIVNDELHLDGSCPLCDAMNDCWTLYHKQYADIAKSKGLAVDAPEAKDLLKQDRIDLMNSMPIQTPTVWYAFPIVVIACQEKDGQMTVIPKVDDAGKLQGRAMWYTIRERTFKEKWEAGYDSITLEDGSAPTSPAGLWAILNFTYTPKSGKHDKMGSARALKVTYKDMGDNYMAWAEYFDKLTEGWTPEKAQDTLVLAAVRDMDEMNEVRDTLMKPVYDKLSMYELGEQAKAAGAVGVAPVASSAEAALAGFGAMPAPVTGGAAPANPVAEMPGNVGVE